MNVNFKSIILCSAIAVISGCVSAPQASQDSKIEDVVAKRAGERWGYVIKGDYVKAYEYFVPSVKGVKTTEAFAGSFGRGLRLESAEPVSVLCSETDRCNVRYKIGAVVPVRGFTNQIVYREIEEVWLLESGQWGYFEK